jgi:hypothetical protein
VGESLSHEYLRCQVGEQTKVGGIKLLHGSPRLTLPQTGTGDTSVLTRISPALCYAEELRHEDGSYRPYWFLYPRLGE